MASPGISLQERFEKVMERVFWGIVEGTYHLKIGRGVAEAVLNDAVIASVCEVFWKMTVRAHLYSAQMFALKLFDKQKDAITVEYLLNLADQCSASFQEVTPGEVTRVTNCARSEINDLERDLEPLRAKRDKILAHADRKAVNDPEGLTAETTVAFPVLQRVFDTAGNILNELSKAYSGKKYSLELLDSDDFNDAIQLIADVKHHEADKFEEQHGLSVPFPRPKRPKSVL